MADASPGVERDAQGYSWALWSRDFPVEYSPGEVVLVALNRDPATGLARIVKLDVEEPSVYRGRALVQYFDKENSFAHVRPARLNKLLFAHNERRVIVVRTTDDYRALAKSQVVGKHVVEIGSSYGACTNVLAHRAASVIGLETSMELVTESRARYPTLRFEHVDCLLEKRRVLELAGRPGHVFLGECNLRQQGRGSLRRSRGTRDLKSLAHIIPWVQRELRPELVVVKAQELFRSAVAFAESHGCKPEGFGACDVRAWWGEVEAAVARSEEEEEQRRLSERAAGPRGPVEVSPDAPIETWPDWKRVQMGRRFHGHPLSFPVVRTPGGVGICRYFNYGRCAKGDECDFDHTTCHNCRALGHAAQDCREASGFEGTSSTRVADAWPAAGPAVTQSRSEHA